MNNTKTTKRALLTSAFSMIICVAMLIGTTFAWFTDSASTGVNKIQAGNLKIQLLDESGNDLEGRTLAWQKADGHESEEVLWEPGCKYELQPITIKNNGNLALKYKIVITGIKGSAKLNDAIDWEIKTDDTVFDFDTYHSLAAKGNANDSDKLTISGKMKPDAGNEYQGLTIDGIGITVVATQDTVENDSVDNQYDKDATYLNTDADGNYLISNANELVYFAKTVNVDGETYAGKTVKLTADIDLAGKKWIPVGQTQVSSFQGTFDGQGHTIKNMTVNYTGTNSNYACGLFGWIELHNCAPIVIQNVKFDNANVTGIKYTGVVAGYANGASGAEIKNCVVTNSTVTSNSKNAGGIIGYMGKGVLTGNTVSGCTISAKYDVGGIANSVEPAVTFTENKVENTKIYYEEDQSYDAAGIFTGGKVVYRDDNNKTTFVPDSTNTNSNVTVNKLVAVNPNAQTVDFTNYATDTEFVLNNYTDLKAFANELNVNGKSFSGKTVKLGADIDLANTEWTPIGQTVGNGTTTWFQGTFDGDNHTIKNLAISASAWDEGANYAAGLFGFIDVGGATIKNLTIDGARVEGHHWTGAVVGYLTGTVENCRVKNATITSTHANDDACGDKVGAVVGYINTTDSVVRGCTAYKCTIKAGRDAGQIVGCNTVSASVTGCSADKVTVEATGDCTGNNIKNEIVGRQ